MKKFSKSKKNPKILKKKMKNSSNQKIMTMIIKNHNCSKAKIPHNHNNQNKAALLPKPRNNNNKAKLKLFTPVKRNTIFSAMKIFENTNKRPWKSSNVTRRLVNKKKWISISQRKSIQWQQQENSILRMLRCLV